MATGKSGYVDFTATNTAEGNRVLRVYWAETYTGSTSTVSITKVQFSSSAEVGVTYLADFIIKINGTTAATLSEPSWTVYPSNFNTFYDIKRSGTDVSGSVSVAHDSQGKANATISISANSWSYAGLVTQYYQHSAQFSGSQTVALTTLPVGTLSVSAGAGSSISVKRNGTALSAGASLYYGDVLTITFSASTGYNLGTHTVNGTTFTSGNTHTVSGNVSVVSTASLKTYTLSISAGTGTSITVKRGATTLSNGATITHNDVLTVTYSVSTGYTINTHTINGAAFNSGATYTVTGATTVATTATKNTYTLSISQGANTTITVKRNGVTLTNGASISYGDSLTITFAASSGYSVVTHTVNGSTFTSGNTHTVTGNVTVVSSASASLSTISTGNGTFGTAQTITVTRYNNSYTHTIVAACAGQTQTIATKSSSTSISWTPAVSIMDYITNAMSASCTLTVTTYSGDTALGSTTLTLTLSLPTSGGNSVKPTPSLSVSDAMGYSTTYGGYVQGKSKAAVTVTDGLKRSATLATRSTTANGTVYTAASFTTNILTTSGSNTISTTVKDSRGQVGTASTSITVLSYTAPIISAFGVHRCDSGGTADDDGTYFYISYDVAITSLNSHNTRSLQYRYRQSGGAWGAYQTITLSAYTQSGNTSPIDISAGVALGSGYEVELKLTDAFGSVSKTTKLSTVPVIFDVFQNGNGAAFGKVSEASDTFDVAWQGRFRQDIRVGANAKVRLWEDGEGGNIRIWPPSGTVVNGEAVNYWEADAFDGSLRIFGNVTSGGVDVNRMPFFLDPSGRVRMTDATITGTLTSKGGTVGQSAVAFGDYGGSSDANVPTFYANLLMTYLGNGYYRLRLSGMAQLIQSASSTYAILSIAKIRTAINTAFSRGYSTFSLVGGTFETLPALQTLSNAGYGLVVLTAGDGNYLGFGRRYNTSGSTGSYAQSWWYNANGRYFDVEILCQCS